MKKLFFTVFLSLLVMGAYAQKKTLKSAQKALNKKEYGSAIDLATQAAGNAETANNPQVFVILGTANLYQYIDDKTKIEKAQASYDNFQKAIELGDEKLKGKIMEDVIMNNEGARLGGGEGLMYLQNMLNIQGNTHFEAGDYADAYKYFSLSASITPEDIVMAFYAGYSAYGGELDSKYAVEHYEKVLSLNEALPEEQKFENANFAYNGLIDIYFDREENYDKALEYIRAAKNAYPEEKLYKDYEIDVLIKAEKMDEAIDGLKAVVASGDASEGTYYTLAYLQWNNEDFDEALASADEALKLNPKYYDALYVAGSVHFNQAAEKLKEANNTNDNDEYAKLLEEAKEKFKLAMPYFEKAIVEKPEDMFSLNPLSTIYDQLDMDDKRDAILAKIDEIEGK